MLPGRRGGFCVPGRAVLYTGIPSASVRPLFASSGPDFENKTKSMTNLGQMVKMAQEFQSRMGEMQEKLTDSEIHRRRRRWQGRGPAEVQGRSPENQHRSVPDRGERGGDAGRPRSRRLQRRQGQAGTSGARENVRTDRRAAAAAGDAASVLGHFRFTLVHLKCPVYLF